MLFFVMIFIFGIIIVAVGIKINIFSGAKKFTKGRGRLG